ncbi:MAG: DUF2214 family protein [Chlorobi bacterium]|nr:DUF2214 family protein [Chlorobiota bacterium]
MNILIPYLHFLGIMILTGSLMAMYILVTSGLSKTKIKLISDMNVLYWVSLVVILITGLVRWFMIGKHASFYNSNPLFHTKVTLFAIIAILAVFSSIRIGKWKSLIHMGRVSDISDRESDKFLWLLRIQFLLIAIIPFLAVMVNIGY